MITSWAFIEGQSACLVLAVAIAAAAVFTSGCSNMNMMSAPSKYAWNGAAIQGKVHGGQSPIKGSTIGLFVAGSSGLWIFRGSQSAIDYGDVASGSFSISNDYPCTAPIQLVYLTLSGGDPGRGVQQ